MIIKRVNKDDIECFSLFLVLRINRYLSSIVEHWLGREKPITMDVLGLIGSAEQRD